ncbi:virion structural protein [Xanthomonas phage Pfeifenkraut]|uniref:Virion structural protein n=1 Tax=Xanthomonas phage Pfeifenkraut TaxID=2939132 RepID=A0A9E7E126_9CAUD|nr:virion structural protein [Xanthomonas phage Pfeifenkraut]URA06921.1 virion structural protein [Xanthomonas phage Pfeifenkraut]
MAIQIIVEDGTEVADANAYVDVAAVRAYAEQRGVTLPADDEEVAAMIIKATDYLESFACKYQGRKTDCDQSLQWPRTGVVMCCADYPSNQIPKQLKSAQCAAILIQNEGLVLQPNVTAADYVIEETVGPITTKYANPIQAGISAQFTALDSLLEPLFFASCGQVGLALRTIRV